MQKKLTIGIGTYGKNRNYIDKTLNSIIALLKKYRYTNKTIITVCNDDKEYSLDYITALKFQKKNPNLIVCKDNGQNLGIAKTYQKMCFECETPYFLQFDSDDIIGNFNIKQQIQFLDKNEQYCGSYGTKICFNQQGKFLGKMGSQYQMTNYKLNMNNNAMLLRVQDCKKIGFYFPDFFTLQKPFDGICDIVMWFGMALKKPMYFDDTVRTFGLQHSDGNSKRTSDQRANQFQNLKHLLSNRYGIFSDSWTIYQKQLYYTLFNKYLTAEQKNQYWRIIGQQKFVNTGLLVSYIDYLYSNHKYEYVLGNLYLALLKNDNVKNDVLRCLIKTNLVQNFTSQFVSQMQKNENIPCIDTAWFEKFFQKQK